MKVYDEIIGNIHDPVWAERLKEADVECLALDQWTAQKSRFLARDGEGREYPVALRRGERVTDGDILLYDPDAGRAVVLCVQLSPVMVVELDKLCERPAGELLRRAVELGHAIGNQHWPAVVKGTKVYVPLTVDKKVMLSVMETHHLEGVTYGFRPGREVIPYLAPHEVRRLFGGAGQEESCHHHHAETPREHAHPHPHPHYV